MSGPALLFDFVLAARRRVRLDTLAVGFPLALAGSLVASRLTA